MPKITTPHEFLVRWDDAGQLQGAHIVYREAFTDDAGVEQFSKFGDPLPVLLTDAALLTTIGGDINTAALADGVDKAAQITTLTADKDAAVTAKGLAEAARDTAIGERAALAEQLAALQSPVDANGIPKEVTMQQAQQIMLRTPTATPGVTLLDAVEAAVQQLGASGTVEGRSALIAWTKSAAVKRTHPLIAQLSAALGLTDAQIDALFVAAAKV